MQIVDQKADGSLPSHSFLLNYSVKKSTFWVNFQMYMHNSMTRVFIEIKTKKTKTWLTGVHTGWIWQTTRKDIQTRTTATFPTNFLFCTTPPCGGHARDVRRDYSPLHFFSEIAALLKIKLIKKRTNEKQKLLTTPPWTLAMQHGVWREGSDQSVMTSVSNTEVKVLPCRNKGRQDKVLNCSKGHGSDQQYF